MVIKEWRDARWKLAAATVLVLLAALVSPIPIPYEEIQAYMGGGQVERFAVGEMWGMYSAGGFLVLMPLAALLGVTLFSAEAGGSIFLLLSRPVSRTRLFLVKYAVCAGVLLVAAFLGALLMVAVVAAHGYPIWRFVDVLGITLSALLIWLGALCVLGVALLASVLFRNVASSVAAAGAALFVAALFPDLLNAIVGGAQWAMGVADCGPRNLYIPCGLRLELLDKARLYSYWYSEDLFRGTAFAPINFLVSAIAAGVPFIGALCAFDRKAY